MSLARILTFAAVVEIGTGLVLLIDPAIVAKLLLGAELEGVGIVLGRCFGIALLALGLAAWPRKAGVHENAPAFRAMSTYNVLLAGFLFYLGMAGLYAGLLLWPGFALHAVVGLLLLWTWHKGTSVTASAS